MSKDLSTYDAEKNVGQVRSLNSLLPLLLMRCSGRVSMVRRRVLPLSSLRPVRRPNRYVIVLHGGHSCLGVTLPVRHLTIRMPPTLRGGGVGGAARIRRPTSSLTLDEIEAHLHPHKPPRCRGDRSKDQQQPIRLLGRRPDPSFATVLLPVCFALFLLQALPLVKPSMRALQVVASVAEVRVSRGLEGEWSRSMRKEMWLQIG